MFLVPWRSFSEATAPWVKEPCDPSDLMAAYPPWRESRGRRAFTALDLTAKQAPARSEIIFLLKYFE